MRRRYAVVFPFVLLLTLTYCDALTEPRGPYRLEILFSIRAPTSHGWPSWGHAINQAGEVVGMSAVERQGDAEAATLWGLDGVPRLLDAHDVQFARANGINDLGQIVGQGRCSDSGATILSYYSCISENGQARALGSHGTYHGHSSAAAINNHGDIVGWSQLDPTAAQYAMLWRNGEVISLGTLGGNQSEALAINDVGQVVGWARPSEIWARHAFLWENGTMIDLGTMNTWESMAFGINERSQVVGWLGDIYDKRAFIWENGTMRLLPGGPEFSQAFGINNHGDVVGHVISVSPAGTSHHAVLWRDGTRYDLQEMVDYTGITLTWATGINDAGQITGVGRRGGVGPEFAFRLTPR